MNEEIYPPPTGFTDEQIADDPILRFYNYEHLPEKLKITSIKFFELACFIIAVIPRSAERTVALRKLLESKDAAVRATI